MNDMITINGEQRTIEHPCTLEELLGELGMAGRPVVIEQNGIAVPPAQFATTTASPGDRLEIIAIVAGG